MLKAFLSLTLVSLLSLPCLAMIEQQQAVGLGLGSHTLFEGHGDIGNTNVLVAALGQTTIEDYGLWAIQDDNAVLTEKSAATSQSGLLETLQDGTVLGAQSQFIGTVLGPQNQGQSLDVALTEGIGRTLGPSVVGASHEFIGARFQSLGSLIGTMSANQLIKMDQAALVDGGACSDGVITGGAFLNTTQVQATD